MSKPAEKTVAGRTKLFARGVSVREATPDDLKFLWAAYRQGGLPEAFFPPEMSPEDFKSSAIDLLGGFAMCAVIERDGRPYGLVVGRVEHQDGAERCWPHIQWLPWATARAKLEGAVRLAQTLRRKCLAIAIVREKDKDFWTHVCRYGVMRRAGTIQGYFGAGEHAPIFHTVEGKDG